jgi:sn-glycerol 3-phosphate transport system ATP-binding protein
VILPLSKTSIAALFVIQFIYGWNQYLWPLLVTTQESMYTTVIGIKRMITSGDQLTEWNLVMATAILAMLPPGRGRDPHAALVREGTRGDRKVDGRNRPSGTSARATGRWRWSTAWTPAIADGEFIVIVGPSGCGKSTLLRMIAGLETITSGEIAIGGTVVNEVEPKDRNIAMVFQNYALYPHMTVYENMSYGLRIRRLPPEEINARVQRAAKILELSPFLQRRPRELSGGQRQRVAMGRAIVREPAAFLFDEPLSNLDAKLRVQMRLEIQKLHRELRTTSIFVTHDQVEAMTLADRMIVMHAGVAEQVGRPMTVYDDPNSLFVAGFIGSPAMNFLAGKRQGDDVALAEPRCESRCPPSCAPRPRKRSWWVCARNTWWRARAARCSASRWTRSRRSAPIRWCTARSARGPSLRAWTATRPRPWERQLAFGAMVDRLYFFDAATGRRLRP